VTSAGIAGRMSLWKERRLFAILKSKRIRDVKRPIKAEGT
jgi:hypothetical protein